MARSNASVQSTSKHEQTQSHRDLCKRKKVKNVFCEILPPQLVFCAVNRSFDTKFVLEGRSSSPFIICQSDERDFLFSRSLLPLFLKIPIYEIKTRHFASK